MKGTEKQIEWATRILDGWKEDIQKEIDNAKLRVIYGDFPKIWEIIVEMIAFDKVKTISSFDAAKIIELRQTSLSQKMMQDAHKYYDKYKQDNSFAEKIVEKHKELVGV